MIFPQSVNPPGAWDGLGICWDDFLLNIYKDADKAFWTDCKTPEPFPKEGQSKGEAISELTADLEQYTFVRYGNDAIKACRDFQRLKEDVVQKELQRSPEGNYEDFGGVLDADEF